MFSKRFNAVESDQDVKFVCKECKEVAAPAAARNGTSDSRQHFS